MLWIFYASKVVILPTVHEECFGLENDTFVVVHSVKYLPIMHVNCSLTYPKLSVVEISFANRASSWRETRVIFVIELHLGQRPGYLRLPPNQQCEPYCYANS